MSKYEPDTLGPTKIQLVTCPDEYLEGYETYASSISDLKYKLSSYVDITISRMNAVDEDVSRSQYKEEAEKIWDELINIRNELKAENWNKGGIKRYPRPLEELDAQQKKLEVLIDRFIDLDKRFEKIRIDARNEIAKRFCSVDELTEKLERHKNRYYILIEGD